MIGDDKLFAPLPASKRPSSSAFKRSVKWKAERCSYAKLGGEALRLHNARKTAERRAKRGVICPTR